MQLPASCHCHRLLLALCFLRAAFFDPGFLGGGWPGPVLTTSLFMYASRQSVNPPGAPSRPAIKQAGLETYRSAPGRGYFDGSASGLLAQPTPTQNAANSSAGTARGFVFLFGPRQYAHTPFFARLHAVPLCPMRPHSTPCGPMHRHRGSSSRCSARIQKCPRRRAPAPPPLTQPLRSRSPIHRI